MTDRDPTCIGRVRHVLGSTITVALDPKLAGVAPIFRGQLLAVGQIGSLVRLPQGLVDLIGSVTLLGIAELSGPLAPTDTVEVGERWLQVQLLGEIDRGTKRFRRGVGSYPGLDDPVHFTTAEQLGSVFPQPDGRHLQLGHLTASEHVPVCLDAQRLVTRHCAIVGSTGSGKTSAVASLLQKFVAGGWGAANIVVVDPHGEYGNALAGHASIRSVLAQSPDDALRVPYWALPSAEILRIFTRSVPGGSAVSRFSELVVQERRAFLEKASWLNLDAAAVTADTPIPFDLRVVWHRMDFENNETRAEKGDPDTVELLDGGDAATLRPAKFRPYAAAGRPPHKGPEYQTYGRTPELLRLGLMDPRLQFFQKPPIDLDGTDDPLVSVIREWLGNDNPISVLDFSGVPADAADLAIGVVINLLFEVSLRSPVTGQGVGRPNPVLIVLEEAHRYLGTDASDLTRESANRVAREGRKYGVGLLLVSQRPDELPKTALAQCGTLVALRLSNQGDQGTIRAALPDSIAGLAAVLPSLRTGEAVVSGEALVLPARVLIDAPSPSPLADDPSLRPWREAPRALDVGPQLAEWRGTYET